MTFLPVPENQKNPSDISRQEIERLKKLAQEMKKNAQGYQKTEMVSGWVVPKSKAERLAGALQSSLGSYKEQQAYDTEAQKDANAQSTIKNAMEAYARAIGGGTSQTADGETITWNKQPVEQAGNMFANMLMQNQDTSDLGMQAFQDQMKSAQDINDYEQKRQLDAKYAVQRSTQDPKLPTSFLEYQLEQQYPDYASSRRGATVNNRKLSASEQKEIFDLQDKQASIEGALSGLTQASSIYNRAEGQGQPYTGMGADFRTGLARVPVIGDFLSDKERAAATTEAKNLVTEQALNNMKAIFGGNPTEGERNILLQLQALPSMTPEEQNVVINNAIQAANRRKQNYEQRLSQIQSGQYFQQQPQPYVGKQQTVSPIEGVPMLTMEDLNGRYSPPPQQIQPPVMPAQQNQMQAIDRGGYTEYVPMQQSAPQQPSFEFNSIEEAEAANLPSGTVIIVGGRKAVIE